MDGWLVGVMGICLWVEFGNSGKNTFLWYKIFVIVCFIDLIFSETQELLYFKSVIDIYASFSSELMWHLFSSEEMTCKCILLMDQTLKFSIKALQIPLHGSIGLVILVMLKQLEFQESWNHVLCSCPCIISLSWKEELHFKYYEIKLFEHNTSRSVIDFTRCFSFQQLFNHAKDVWHCLVWVHYVLKAWSFWLMTVSCSDRLITPLVCLFVQITVNPQLIPFVFRNCWMV